METTFYNSEIVSKFKSLNANIRKKKEELADKFGLDIESLITELASFYVSDSDSLEGNLNNILAISMNNYTAGLEAILTMMLVQNKHKQEKDAKNKAYSFIIANGLQQEFQKFTNHYQDINYQQANIDMLLVDSLCTHV